MCEFKVYLRDCSGEERIVAEEIIRVKRRGNKLVLSDVLGLSKELSSIIDEVDVSKEHIRLLADPFLGKVAELLGAYYEYLEEGEKGRVEAAIKELNDSYRQLLDKVKG